MHGWGIKYWKVYGQIPVEMVPFEAELDFQSDDSIDSDGLVRLAGRIQRREIHHIDKLKILRSTGEIPFNEEFCETASSSRLSVPNVDSLAPDLAFQRRIQRTQRIKCVSKLKNTESTGRVHLK
jgi:hypothetical protein